VVDVEDRSIVLQLDPKDFFGEDSTVAPVFDSLLGLKEGGSI
jgi:hypothetical protein